MPSVKPTYSTNFKAKVVIACLKGDKTVQELENEFAVSAEDIVKWKQQLLSNIHLVFEQEEENLNPADVKANHAKIGELIAENDFLTKILGR